jgi:hypothetical protein
MKITAGHSSSGRLIARLFTHDIPPAEGCVGILAGTGPGHFTDWPIRDIRNFSAQKPPQSNARTCDVFVSGRILDTLFTKCIIPVRRKTEVPHFDKRQSSRVMPKCLHKPAAIFH